MENTSALLFDNSQQKFFLAIDKKAIGPLTTQELYEKLHQGQCHFLSYIWCEGWEDWKHVYEVADFKDMLPPKPDKAVIKKMEVKLHEKRRQKSLAEAVSVVPAKNWYLYFNGAQYGPFSDQEILHVIEVQNVDTSAFVWKAPWSQWKSIKEVPEMSAALKPALPVARQPMIEISKKAASIKSSSKTKAESEDHRTSPRKPLVARLFISNDKEVVVAVCRDISMGGMQVLTDHVPGDVGTKIKLNVSPSDVKTVKGFVAEGIIVRVLEDGRGFSFRFTKLSEDAKKAIQSYIK